MADTKISALTAITSGHAVGDLLPLVDVSDTTQAASGTTKQTTLQNLFENVPGTLKVASSTLSSASGNGIKVDTASPTYPWHDIIGNISPKTSGAGTPSFRTYNGNISAFSFIANDIVDCVFHVPHDYAPGTDIYLHVHWSHNGTNVTGTAEFTYYATYAKGHNQAAFPTEVTGTVSYATVDLATTPRYQHRIDEVALSVSGGSASKLDTDDIETDGLILVRIKLTSLPSVTGGYLFIHTSDIHYQSTNIGTKNKSPAFYA